MRAHPRMGARTLGILIVTVGFGILLGRLLTEQATLREQGRREEHGPARVLQLTGVVMEQLDGPELRSQIWAERAIYDEDTQETWLEVVRFRIIPKLSGTPTAGSGNRVTTGSEPLNTPEPNLGDAANASAAGAPVTTPLPVEGTALQARLERQEQRLTLEGKVQVWQGTDLELSGERLVYRYVLGLLQSEDPVRARDTNTHYKGSALEYKIAQEQLWLREPRIIQ